MVQVKVKRARHSNNPLPLPVYQTPHAAGMDLTADIESPIVLEPGERKLIPTGLIIELPVGFEAQIRPRSGLALKKGLTMANSPGTIDADYRGEVGVIAINLGRDTVVIERGERIAQMIVAPVVQAQWIEVEEVGSTARGAGGFGSTGISATGNDNRGNR